MARMEKQRDKVAKRQQRKAEKESGQPPADDLGEPVGNLFESEEELDRFVGL